MTTFANGESGLSVRTKINNVLQHADGTAGELVINEAGADVDFRVESDTNANALFVDGATGNVGIGTSSPSTLLHLGGANNKSVRLDTALGNAAFLTGWENTAQFGVNRNPATGVVTDSGKAAACVRMVGEAGNSYVTVETTSTNNATPTERLRIDAAGNVGIGTSSPAAALHLQGVSSNEQRTLRLAFDGTYYAELYQNGSGGLEYKTFGGLPHIWSQGGTERMRIDASGNVGIGTSNPSTALHINRSGAVDAALLLSNATASTAITQSADGNLYCLNFGANSLIFGTNAAERLRIDASGNLLVGTTGGLLNERIRAEFAAGNTGITVSVASTAVQSHIAFYNGAVVGSISTLGSATSYNTSSDYRLKEYVQPVADAISRLNALNPVNFAWKADGTRTDGFIAHEVQAVVPQAVTGEKDAVNEDGTPIYQSIDHSKLVPLLTAALQEALTRIAALEAKLNP